MGNSWLDLSSINGTDHQLDQLAIATRGDIGCFTGKAGTGKTTMIGQILDSFAGDAIVLCPTGKAASRVREVFPNASAMTAHSALQPQRAGRDGGGWSFARNRSFPLDTDLIILEEWSMADTSITFDVLNAVKRGTKVLVVGDPRRQLSPVGRGKPFIDMIDAGMSHGSLTELHRFAGRIAHVCNDISEGRNWSASSKIDLNSVPKENLVHVEANAPSIPSRLKSFVEQFLSKGYSLDQIQIITPCNTSGDLCREKLNSLLQGWFNPASSESPEIVGKFDEGKAIKQKFRINDRVICLSNNYSQRDPADGETFEEAGNAFVANGDTGTIIGTKQHKGKLYVQCRMPPGIVIYELSEFRDIFTLAYAITCHKSQGSQWPVVIVVIDDSNGGRMVTGREWYYTACTRASEICCLVGPRNAMLQQCRTVRIHSRKTFLASEIKRLRPTGLTESLT